MNLRRFLKTVAFATLAAPTVVKELCKPKLLTVADLDKLASELQAIPNPEYVNATYEVHFWCTEDAYDTIKVGPPLSVVKFDASQFWNGETKSC